MSCRVEIAFSLNGRPVRTTVPAEMSTLAMLRDALQLTGAKLACGEGECGACTVLVDGRSQNACLMYAVDLDGREVETVEGLRGDELHPLQRAFVAHGAIQCGFCTPGLIMQARYLVENGLASDREALKRGLEGNLCRCTGYAKVLDAIAEVAGLER
ncbi:MAG: (2Fe-2S)-binding protein [Alphaproteobacteria bacterium]|jgi:carbon-monoxide dehydrogenase small subunit|nr:(2Fe-2S)-binding protein [Alphaproteobacteria bacterium]